LSLRLTVNMQELYAQLCPECREKLVRLVKVAPSEEDIRRALEGKKEAKE